MPYFIFQKPKGTTAWKLKGSFKDYGAARSARDGYTSELENTVARMVLARTEYEARGKNGGAWNAITHDSDNHGDDTP